MLIKKTNVFRGEDIASSDITDEQAYLNRRSLIKLEIDNVRTLFKLEDVSNVSALIDVALTLAGRGWSWLGAKEILGSWLMPALMGWIVLYGWSRRIDVYDAVVKGGREGFDKGLEKTIEWFTDPANLARYPEGYQV